MMLRKIGAFLFLTTLTHAELLIVKQTAAGFEPLSEEESVSAGEVISPILLKYQWPMVIASDLTEEEQNELLSPSPGGEPYKEAKFIEAKIRAHGGEFENYRVVFIPTCLYELFVIGYYFRNKSMGADIGNPLQIAVTEFNSSEQHSIDKFESLLASRKPAFQVKIEINKLYQDVNKIFFSSHEDRFDNAWMYVNSLFTHYLFENYPDLKRAGNLNDAVKLFSTNSSVLTSLIAILYESAAKPIYGVNFTRFIELVRYLKSDVGKIIVEKVIGLEYESTALNRALLLRGTNYESFYVGVGAPPQEHEIERLAGTTISIRGGSRLYSISFGNSLFAEIINDPGASVYTYLARVALHGSFKEKAIGYALFIDKKGYYQHRLNRLFFIPPLGTLPALYARGGYFHPRSTVATAPEYKRSLDVWGMLSESFTDFSGNILITRDPLYHAELFSKFIADNGRVIQVDPTGRYASSQAEFAEKIIGSQRKAASFYKASGIAKKLKKRLKRKKG